MNNSEFDRCFDAGDAVLYALDLDAATWPRLQQKRVNVDFPLWMVEQLDHEAIRLGVTWQSIIKVRPVERLERRTEPSPGTATLPARSQQPSAEAANRPHLLSIEQWRSCASATIPERILQAYPLLEPADIDEALASQHHLPAGRLSS